MSSTPPLTLLPCPFCGSPGKVSYYGPESRKNREFSVGCSNGQCFALNMGGQFYLQIDHGYGEIERRVQEWNTRSVQSETTESRPPEVRLNDDKTLDEVCADSAQFHLEQMTATHWWMAVECGGKRVHVNLHSKATIKANHIEEQS